MGGRWRACTGGKGGKGNKSKDIESFGGVVVSSEETREREKEMGSREMSSSELWLGSTLGESVERLRKMMFMGSASSDKKGRR